MSHYLIEIGETHESVSSPGQRSMNAEPVTFEGGRVLLSDTTGDVSVAQSNDSVLLLDGYVSGCVGLDVCADSQRNCANLLPIIREHWRRGTLAEILHSASGSFSLIYIDIPTLEVVAVTDRISSRPVSYITRGHRSLFSSSATELASAAGTKSTDPAGILSYVLYGAQMDPTCTIFGDVISLNEGTIANYKAPGSLTQSSWYSFNHVPEHSRRPREWLDECAIALTRSAERTAKVSSSPLLFFSGGVDSRITAAAMVAAGIKPILLSLGDSENTEIRVARRVARALDCRHDVHYRDSNYYLRTLDRSAEFTNGTHSWIHGHFAEAYAQKRRELGIDSALLGDFCEAFSKLFCSSPISGPGYSEAMFIQEFDRLPLPNYRPTDRERSLRLFNEDFREHGESVLKDRILQRYRKALRVSQDGRIVGDYFFRWQRADCLPTYSMLYDVRTAGPERNLMFDKDLISLLERMPSCIRTDHRLGAKLVSKLHRGAGMLPDANSLLPLPVPGSLHRFSKRMRPVLGKLRRQFLSDTYRTTASWPHLPLLMQRDPAWRSFLEESIFQGRLLQHAGFDSAAVHEAWSSFLGGDLSWHGDFERIASLAIILRKTAPA